LTEFEEHDWPHWIEDPLPFDPNIDPRDRLRRTVEALNKSLRKSPLVFHITDGGAGVKWSLRKEGVSRSARRGASGRGQPSQGRAQR
jgi:hypothetical protein